MWGPKAHSPSCRCNSKGPCCRTSGGYGNRSRQVYETNAEDAEEAEDEDAEDYHDDGEDFAGGAGSAPGEDLDGFFREEWEALATELDEEGDESALDDADHSLLEEAAATLSNAAEALEVVRSMRRKLGGRGGRGGGRKGKGKAGPVAFRPSRLPRAAGEHRPRRPGVGMLGPRGAKVEEKGIEMT